MEGYLGYQKVRRACSLISLVMCLVVILGGCGEKAPPLSKEAQALKGKLLGNMGKLTQALTAAVAQQDWEAVRQILQRSYEEMEKQGKAR